MTGGSTLNERELSDLNTQLVTARADLADKQAKLRLVRDLRMARKPRWNRCRR